MIEWHESAARVGADEALCWILSVYETIDLDKVPGVRVASKWIKDPELVEKRERKAQLMIETSNLHEFRLHPNATPEEKEAARKMAMERAYTSVSKMLKRRPKVRTGMKKMMKRKPKVLTKKRMRIWRTSMMKMLICPKQWTRTSRWTPSHPRRPLLRLRLPRLPLFGQPKLIHRLFLRVVWQQLLLREAKRQSPL